MFTNKFDLQKFVFSNEKYGRESEKCVIKVINPTTLRGRLNGHTFPFCVSLNRPQINIMSGVFQGTLLHYTLSEMCFDLMVCIP